MPENILIYYPPAKRSNVIETLALEFLAKGHKIFLLTHAAHDDIHESLGKQGILVFSHPLTKGKLFYLRHFLFLISFCKKHKITAIQSHLQPANIIAVFAQYFLSVKLVVYRHHHFENNKISKLFDRIINRLAKKIVAPSSLIFHKMIDEEGVPEKKVKLVHHVYDFSKYHVFPERIDQIKKDHPSRLRILLCGRFVPLKRNDLAIKATAALIEKGKNICLIALDSGPGLDECKRLAQKLGIEKYVSFIGYTPHAVDFIAACDVLIHPSFTEVSNNTVKEAGSFSKKVVVCEGVGDFSDFILNRVNGYVVNREDPLPGMIQALEEIYDGKTAVNMGEELKKIVLKKFQKSPQTIDKHLDLLIR